MNINKRLLITFSNGVQCSGLLSVNFAKEHISQLFSEEDVCVNIYEISKTDNSLTPLWKRVNGDWKEMSIN